MKGVILKLTFITIHRCRTLSTAGQLCLQLSLQPTEYSYFDMDKLSTWAGPQHWKLKPHSKGKDSVRTISYQIHCSSFILRLAPIYH